VTATGATTVWRCCIPLISSTRHPRARALARPAWDRASARRLLRPRVAGLHRELVGKLKEREVWLNEHETIDDARRGIGGNVDRYHHDRTRA
jgi:hypothetical protein